MSYKFYVLRRTKFCLKDSQKRSLTNTWTVTVQLLVSRFWTVTVWPLLRFLTISGFIELRFKLNLWCWKGKTWGYKFYVLRRTQFCLYDCQNCSLTNTWTVTIHLLVSRFWTVTLWPLLRFLTMYGVIKLRFKQNLRRWKGKTWGYKFYVLRRTQFCL